MDEIRAYIKKIETDIFRRCLTTEHIKQVLEEDVETGILAHLLEAYKMNWQNVPYEDKMFVLVNVIYYPQIKERPQYEERLKLYLENQKEADKIRKEKKKYENRIQAEILKYRSILQAIEHTAQMEISHFENQIYELNKVPKMKSFHIALTNNLAGEESDSCPCCFDPLNQSVVYTNCHHSMCCDCFIPLIESTRNNKTKCPQCRETISSVSCLPESYRRLQHYSVVAN
jgi:hypothetical protein